jgi:Protein of unknown function (DUF3072)
MKNLSEANSKIDPAPNSNTEKDPDDWVSGDEPMTGAQASYLKTPSEECDEPDAFAPMTRKSRITGAPRSRNGTGCLSGRSFVAT